MKKVCKVLSLILIVVLSASVLVGCASFGKNAKKYRESVAIKVGSQNVTIGEVLDSFNNYYSNYYSYISAGYVTVDQLLDMAISSLYSQYAKIDAYITDNASATYQHAWAGKIANAQFVSESEMQYAIKYMKYTMYDMLDGEVEELIQNAKDFTFNAEEAEDTSRKFYSDPENYDNNGEVITSYSQYLYEQGLQNKEMDEYFTKYYGGQVATDNYSVASYVFADEASAKARLDALNARLPEDVETITFDELKSFQSKALKSYTQSIQNAYDYDTLDEFVEKQVGQMVNSIIVSKYNTSVYAKYESEHIADVLAQLKSNADAKKASQEANYKMDENGFVTFVGSLANGTYIYAVDDNYMNSDTDKFIYVKNVLVKFSDKQTKELANIKSALGGTDNDTYKADRNALAAQIVGIDYSNDEAEVENMFVLEGNEIKLNLANETILKYFDNVGNLLDGANSIKAMMADLNQDTASHANYYDYVVRAGSNIDKDYTASWVSEFVDAANVAYADNAGTANASYGIAVSDYGVHIVFYTGIVDAYNFEFVGSTKYLDPTTAEYAMFKEYIATINSNELEEDAEDLFASYKSKIEATKNFEKFLKDNQLTYDLAAALEEL